jgi:ABC-type multidrug transport system fused ATPase/permease subunit
VAGTIVVISYTSPIFIAVFVPLSLLYWFVQNVYVATSRQLKRLESSTRSPIYSWFGEALNGVATIRAYGLQAKQLRRGEIGDFYIRHGNVAPNLSVFWLSGPCSLVCCQTQVCKSSILSMKRNTI